MDEPEELKETPLQVKLKLDPETKCAAMILQPVCTLEEDIGNTTKAVQFLPAQKDPLQTAVKYTNAKSTELDEMDELQKLIYWERRRLVPEKKCYKDPETGKRVYVNVDRSRKHEFDSDISDTEIASMNKHERYRLKIKKKRASETPEEKYCRNFRQRVRLKKTRLLERLKNFDDLSLIKAISKKNSNRRKQQLMRLTEEQRAERSKKMKETNHRNRQLKKAFMTPEEAAAKNKQLKEWRQRYWCSKTKEEKHVIQKRYRQAYLTKWKSSIEDMNKFKQALQGIPELGGNSGNATTSMEMTNNCNTNPAQYEIQEI